jgi:signal transduction histidine kinase
MRRPLPIHAAHAAAYLPFLAIIGLNFATKSDLDGLISKELFFFTFLNALITNNLYLCHGRIGSARKTFYTSHSPSVGYSSGTQNLHKIFLDKPRTMKKRLYYAIAAILILFGLGAALDFGITKGDHLESYVRRIERSLHKKESEVYTILSDTSFLFRIINGINRLPSNQQNEDLIRLKSLAKKPFNICIYKSDSLVFWLNNGAFLGEEHLGAVENQASLAKLVKLPNGYFELIKKDLTPEYTAIGLLPIKKEFAQKSEFLPNSFVTDDFPIPGDVYLQETETDFALHNMEGNALAYIEAYGQAKDRRHLQLVFLIYILGFIALGIAVNDISLLLVRRFEPWVGAGFMLGAVAVVRWLTLKMGFTAHFAAFQTFSSVFTEPIFEGVNSLGELLINIVLLVWMMVFFNREFEVKEFRHPSLAMRFGLTTLNFFAVNLGMLMVCSILKSIVLDSSIVFDFENVFNLNFQSVMAMVGVVFLLLSLFLFSHRMMTAIHKIGLNKNWRLSALVVSLFLTIPVLIYSKENLQLDPQFFLLASLVYLLSLEYFVDVQSMSLVWLVGWLMLFAAFTSALLYKYNDEKDTRRRIEYAQALASFRDSVAETGLQHLGSLLTNDTAIAAWDRLIDVGYENKLSKEEARDIVEVRMGINKYLLHNYEFKINAFFQRTGDIALTDQLQTLGALEEQYHKSAATKQGTLKFKQEKTRDPGYILRLEIPATQPILLFLIFKRTFSSPSKVYTELLLDKKYKNLDELDTYDYGIYQDRKLVEERNKAYGDYLTDELPPVGEIGTVTHTSRRSELIYHAPDDIVIKIGRDTGGYIKPLSLFSYVFTLLTIAVLMFSGLNYFTNALPGPLNFLRTMQSSLRNQFQIWVIGMILFSFIGIGVVTVLYFQQSSNEYHKGRLDRKVQSALANVHYEIKAWHRERQQEHEIEEKIAQRLEMELGERERAAFEQREQEKEMAKAKSGLDAFSLSSLIPLISEVHRLDVNIYDLNGNLITSSESDIFKRGLIAPKMGAHAYQTLTRLGYDRSDQDESIGDLHYLAAYVPVRNIEGETVAFMGIPYYARQRELRSDVTDFMSTLLNVYVFLLLIAGGLAIVAANTVTKALTELGMSIRRIRLGANEPIIWKRKDEIGDLVNAYNYLIKKLDESSRLLAQSEREGAWREMAKQVAHEIKNPLTPMKLSIQYLQHAYDANRQNIEPLLKRVSTTLIEQIEALAQIATEFSNFAKMPKAQSEEVILNDLAASVHSLFANERPDMDIEFDMPEREFLVYADRTYLTRVLNNLFKNAIQAIPDERQGVITLSMYQKDEKVIMSVADNGQGIPQDIQEKVFTPNFSTKTSGTGLGLAICKSIIEGFGGDIYFKTVENAGTTFYVELPLMKVEEGVGAAE